MEEQEGRGRRLQADWSLGLGEPVMGLQVHTWSSYLSYPSYLSYHSYLSHSN